MIPPCGLPRCGFCRGRCAESCGSANFRAAPVECELGPDRMFVALATDAVPVVLDAEGDRGRFVQEEAGRWSEAEAFRQSGFADGIGVVRAQAQFERARKARLESVEGVGVESEIAEASAFLALVAVLVMFFVMIFPVLVVMIFPVMIDFVGVVTVSGGGDRAEGTEEEFRAPAEVIAAGFESMFAPFVFGVEAGDRGCAVGGIVAPCGGGSEADAVEVIDLDQIGPVCGNEQAFEGG